MEDLHSLDYELRQTHDDLKRRARDLDDVLQHLANDTAAEFSECQAEMIRHKTSQQDIFEGMELLEERFKTMGSMAVRIGDRLDALTKRRQRASAAKTLLKYFDYFNSSSRETTDELFTHSNRLHEAAQVMQQLQSIVLGLNAPGTEEAIHHIEKESQRIKVHLLEEFANAAGNTLAQSNPDIPRMKKLASTILKYDGSENLHSFYVSNVMQKHFEIRTKHQNVSPTLGEQVKLFGHIKEVCQHEQTVMKEVFPATSVATVYQLLLERLFIDPVLGIQAQLETWLKPEIDASKASLAMRATHLDLICSTYQQSMTLVEELLEVYSTDERASKSTGALGTFPRTNNGRGNLVTREFLEGQVACLFVNHKQSYPALEKSLLQQRCVGIISKISLAGVRSKEESNLSGFERLLAYILDSDAVNMFRFSEQAIMRATLMNGGTGHSYRDDESSNTLDTVAQLFAILCSELGEKFLRAIAEKAEELLEQETKSSEEAPPALYFKVVQAINAMVHKLQEHFQQIVLPIIQFYPTKLTVCMERQRSVIEPLEAKITQGVQYSLDALLRHMGHLLSQQDKNDYVPKGDLVLSEATPCCLACVACIRQQFHDISDYLESSDIQIANLWKELAIRLAAMLRAHLKKSRVNMSGALVLMRDIDTYRQAARCFQSSTADKAFEDLHALSSVFMVGQDHLPSLMQDHAHVQDLLEFVQMRDDYSEMKKHPRPC